MVTGFLGKYISILENSNPSIKCHMMYFSRAHYF